MLKPNESAAIAVPSPSRASRLSHPPRREGE